MIQYTFHSEIFAKGFIFAKLRGYGVSRNKNLTKWRKLFVIDQSCEYLTGQICLLTLLAKINPCEISELKYIG